MFRNSHSALPLAAPQGKTALVWDELGRFRRAVDMWQRDI